MRQRLLQIAADIFHFDFSEYLRRENKVLLGLLINREGRQCEPLFGAPPENILAEANRNYLHSEAGYRVSGCRRFSRLEPHADLFLISTTVLAQTLPEIDALLVHELCHMLVDSEYVCDGMLQPTGQDAELVNTLYSAFERIEGLGTGHSPEFFGLLLAAAQQAATVLPGFTNQLDVLRKALQYETARFGLPWFNDGAPRGTTGSWSEWAI